MAIPLTAAGSQCKSSGRTTLKSCINPPADTTFGHHFWPGRLLVRRLLAHSRSAHFWPAPLLARLLAQTDRTVLQTISPNLVQCNCSSGFGQFLFLFSFFNFCVLLLVLCVVWGVCSRFSWMRPRFGCSPGPPLPRTPPPQDPKSPAQNFALFSFSRHNFLSFFPLLGVLSLNFGGVLEDWDPQMFTFGISGCRPAALGPPGFQTTARELQTCTFQGRAIQTPPKFNERTPKRGRKERKLWQERKKGQNFGPPTHPSGPHPSGLHFCMNCVCPPRRTEGGGGILALIEQSP